MIRPLVTVLWIAVLGGCGSTPPKAADPVAGGGEGSAPGDQPAAPMPVEPAPVEPATPAEPVASVEPATPAAPVAPAEPATPAAPAKPATPAAPAKPTTPAAPAAPAAPAKPATPALRPPPPKPDPAQAKADLLAAETRAWDATKPVLQTYCANCHTKGGKGATKKKLAHFDMTSYPVTGHHAATIGATMRNVLGLSGKKPTMPFGKPGAVAGDDLTAVKAWTNAWDAADKGGAHRPRE